MQFASTCVLPHTYLHIYIYIHVYIYIERERSDCIYVFADAMVVSVSGPWPCSCYVRDLIEIRTIHNNTRQTIKPIYKYIAKQINTYETCAQDHVLHDIHIYIYILYIRRPFQIRECGIPFSSTYRHTAQMFSKGDKMDPLSTTTEPQG